MDYSISHLIGHIPEPGQQRSTPQCCCLRTDCAFLERNVKVYDGLEEEVRTVASLGQALLVRHEQYMIDAEKTRSEMSAKIEQLEVDKRELEVENKKTIEENRGLLDQLEGLNDSYQESESQILLLETTLQSTQTEMRRLEILASRTRELEKNLEILEEEQETLRKTIIHSEAEERTAVLRWKKAERGLSDLQNQLERIEREAREERERHVEILGRMERQRAVERELDTAAGRLKEKAAAVSGTGKAKAKHGTNVVSHFVKDILQDNANLQLGIVELREMLMNSNDEVQTLREQLMMHEPTYENDIEDKGLPQTLKAELTPMEEEPETKPWEPQVISQALHIHHHYHTPKKEDTRKPRKKRTSLNSGIFSPLPRGIQSPRTPGNSENTILSQTSVTIPSPINTNNRWSVQSGQISEFAPSSVPSSPQSMYRNSTLFDRGFDLDSRPTSPGSSLDPLSPKVNPTRHRKRGSEASSRSFAATSNFQPNSVIHEEEDNDVQDISDLQNTDSPSLTDDTSELNSSDVSNNTVETWMAPEFESRLHRAPSHESIVSISGIDIHMLKDRPSLLSVSSGSPFIRPRSRLSSPGSTYSTETITRASIITAQPTLSRMGRTSTSYLRHAANTARSPSNDRTSIRSTSSNESPDQNLNIGRKVGGWVLGRWGMAPAKSTNDLRTTSEVQAEAEPQRRVSTPAPPAFPDMKSLMGRAPGINQKGPIPGFVKKVEKPPFKVSLGPDEVDRDALAEVLEE